MMDSLARPRNALLWHHCLMTLKRRTLAVWKLDRLVRSLRDLIPMLNAPIDTGVPFRAITEGIETDTPVGRAGWKMIGILVELERSLIAVRVKARCCRGASARHEIRAQGKTPRAEDQTNPEADCSRRMYGDSFHVGRSTSSSLRECRPRRPEDPKSVPEVPARAIRPVAISHLIRPCSGYWP